MTTGLGEPPAKQPRTGHAAACKSADGAVHAKVVATDLHPPAQVATGIPFLDHMLDQIQSHGQVALRVTTTIDGADAVPAQDYARAPAAQPWTGDPRACQREGQRDMAICRAVGGAVGSALSALAAHVNTDVPGDKGAEVAGDSMDPSTVAFVAPLDEAVCRATLHPLPGSQGKGSVACLLAPFGSTPRAGRSYVGSLPTAGVAPFFEALAEHLHVQLSLEKLKGVNAHHIIESCFKAFARGLRRWLDARSLGPVPGRGPAATKAGRQGGRQRATKETSIDVRLELDSDSNRVDVSTGLSTLDAVVLELARAAGVALHVSCQGDLHVDCHHTVEDVAIALGQALADALGDRKGCTRMGHAAAAASVCAGGETDRGQPVVDRVEAVLDLSNRPHAETDLFADLHDAAEYAGDVAVEMVNHFFASFAVSARATLHLIPTSGPAPMAGDLQPLARDASAEAPTTAASRETKRASLAAAALGTAIRAAVAIDARRAGATASSKGTLSA